MVEAVELCGVSLRQECMIPLFAPQMSAHQERLLLCVPWLSEMQLYVHTDLGMSFTEVNLDIQIYISCLQQEQGANSAALYSLTANC